MSINIESILHSKDQEIEAAVERLSAQVKEQNIVDGDEVEVVLEEGAFKKGPIRGMYKVGDGLGGGLEKGENVTVVSDGQWYGIPSGQIKEIKKLDSKKSDNK